MVSTRGIKSRFCEGERVLCYEPDPTKAKVLYESKVLQTVYKQDNRGKKQIEYLIHFQGWNASWDRCVDEDLVLKDTEENRELQRRLMEEAQIKLKEKKKKRRLSDTIREIVQERHRKERTGSDAGSQLGATDDDDQGSLTSDADSSVALSSRNNNGRDGAATVEGWGEAPRQTAVSSDSKEADYLKEFPLEIPAVLKSVLERDHFFIKEKNKLVQLPCPPAALTVLESYVVFFASRYLARTSERRRSETRLKDKAYLTLGLCKEVMDGLRVLFDFHLKSHLLYTEEAHQAASLASSQPPPYLLKSSLAASPPRSTDESSAKEEIKAKLPDDKSHDPGGRRLTRSSGGRATVASAEAPVPSPYTCDSGRSTPVTTSSSSGVAQQQQQQATAGLTTSGSVVSNSVGASTATSLSSLGPLSHDLLQWTLLPSQHRHAGIPILLYGPLHLLRLFVKLPEIVYRMNLSPEKRKIVLKHLQLFLEYLEVHSQEFFSEALYINNAAEKC
ncbi:male-specific lethal 3 homolog isoform X1 [Hyalella azteca]|uniref:Protein male-specific lethal-3 n=1 Tax=Hyalella azteca TaxID=294128 RepID=A0A979FXJ8_HYAAZ|nr:male-specific lethal 3 homolog isoform X1 [Hyalella azteca]XP_047740863.1 male-specific lethal 3 homolog isoform X1 [Hyalella azteca]XP_047740864.1 male-specific lethal 3 homolog isoform X1 [Hyalella azteca]